jgi:hypothetical protein
VSVNGTRSPARTVKSATVVFSSPTRSTGVRSQAASGPAIASMPSGTRRTQGTIRP